METLITRGRRDDYCRKLAFFNKGKLFVGGQLSPWLKAENLYNSQSCPVWSHDGRLICVRAAVAESTEPRFQIASFPTLVRLLRSEAISWIDNGILPIN